MARSILLTSLSAVENSPPVRYFSFKKEFGFDYCDALLDAEASIKAVLARHPIDEVIVIGGVRACGAEDDLKPVTLGHGSAADRISPSTYGLLQYRLAQYANETSPDREAEDARLPAEVREKLIRFLQDFREKDAALKDKKPNRLFDALAQDGAAWDRLWAALYEAHPELLKDAAACEAWVKGRLYADLKLTAKLELLPVNNGVRLRFFPEDSIEEDKQWVERMMSMQKSIVGDADDIDLFIALGSNDAPDNFLVMSMLDILVSMPGSGVHLKKLFTVRNAQGQLAGTISDDTGGFSVTSLVHAARSFLNYGKADLIVDLWEKSGARNAGIASMIYAMRHVDVGLSMCNISEVEDGILRLRGLFRDGKLWQEFGYHGMLFSVIAESVREDYGRLLEGDGDIPFIELVKWAYRHQFYQQTLTLIESKTPEMLVRRGIFYYCNDEQDKAQVTRLLARQRLELKPYELYKLDDISHYFIKNYDRARTRGLGGRDDDPQRVYAALRVQSLQNTDPALITGFTACDNLDTLQNLLFAYYHIGTMRNKISHADTSAMAESRLAVSESDESSALLWMKDGIDFFIASYERAMAEVQDKKPTVVPITADEVRTAAEHMKYERRREN